MSLETCLLAEEVRGKITVLEVRFLKSIDLPLVARRLFDEIIPPSLELLLIVVYVHYCHWSVNVLRVDHSILHSLGLDWACQVWMKLCVHHCFDRILKLLVYLCCLFVQLLTANFYRLDAFLLVRRYDLHFDVLRCYFFELFHFACCSQVWVYVFEHAADLILDLRSALDACHDLLNLGRWLEEGNCFKVHFA